MYKIYINETPLILWDTMTDGPAPAPGDTDLVTRYPGLEKMFLNYADMLEKTDRFSRVVLYAEDYAGMVRDFERHYQVLEAAGGVVSAPSGKVLGIYRRGFWDLPKGKIDPGESKETAALREISEETGVTDLALGEQLLATHHTYRLPNGKRVLKHTWWFAVTTTREHALLPQEEEDIEKAVWINARQLQQECRPIYRSVLDVLDRWEALRK